MNGDVLNSWKEIAAYMGRGVRTVQRWEQELGLPVRRPRGKERSAVIALKPDLDRWLQKMPQGSPPTAPAGEHQAALHLNAKKLRERTHQIIERSAKMQEMVKMTLALTSRLRDKQAESMRSRGLSTATHRVLVTRTGKLASEIYQRGGAETG